MADPVVFLFGYGSLADPGDPLVRELVGDRPAVAGSLRGFRRRWGVGTENRHPMNDHKHYVEPGTLERPDIVAVALGIDEGDGEVNGLALPVDDEALRRFDRRELHYRRRDVTAAFSEDLGLPVVTYEADDLARAVYAAGRDAGRAFIRRAYFERVERTFRAMGPVAWANYSASTDFPEVPLRDLDHHHANARPGT